MKIKTPLFVLMMSVFNTVTSAEIHKCLRIGQGINYQNLPCTEATQTEMKVVLPRVIERKQITLKLLNGHYFMNGEINGITTPFLIDTGASAVAIPQTLADKARLICSEKFMTVHTANGKINVCVTNVDKLLIMPFEFRNIEVLIHPHLDMPLLGMSVLQNFNIEQHNGEMRLIEH